MESAVTFGSGNRGQQVGLNYGTINAEFHLPPERVESPPTPSAFIPFSRDPDFVNRRDVLDELLRKCSKPAGRAALVGLGGVGKSQLAIEFAHRIAEKQPGTWVFWVHAGTQARVAEGFKMIADRVKLPGRNQPEANISQLLYQWLSNERNGRWIMILDSADDLDVLYGQIGDGAHDNRPYHTYLPQSKNGSIIVTTRNSDLASRLTGGRNNIIDVGPMTSTDALELLGRKLESAQSSDVAKDLVEALDFIPLAISQAAAYIQARGPRISLEKYLANFRKGDHMRSKLLQHDAGDLRRDGGSSNAILTTWTISFEYIRSKRPSAADLLSLMSFFDPQGIPGWILKPSSKPRWKSRWTQKTDHGRKRRATKWTKPLWEFPNRHAPHHGDKTPVGSRNEFAYYVTAHPGNEKLDENGSPTNDDVDGEFENDVAMLRDYCLISTTETADDFKMHGLVQLSTKWWLEASGRQDIFEGEFFRRMAGSFPNGKYENWATCRRLFPHVQVALGYRSSVNTAEACAWLLHKGGRYALEQGNYEVAQQMLGRAMEIREKERGRDDEDTLESTGVFASVLCRQGQWSEAEKLKVQVMEIRKAKLGADHPDTLRSMHNLASTYWKQGRLEEAEKLGVQVMEIRKAKLGADYLDTLRSMGNLASTYWNQGRLEEAEKLGVQVMEMRKAKLGADHPDTLTSMNNLAYTWKGRGRHSEALALMEACARGRQRVLGEEHPDTVSSLAAIAEWSG